MKQITMNREERKLTPEDIRFIESTAGVTPLVLQKADKVFCKICSVVQLLPSALANEFKSYAMLTGQPYSDTFSPEAESESTKQLIKGLGLRSPVQLQRVATFCRNYQILTQED